MLRNLDDFQNKDQLRTDQYKTSQNLNARAELHRRFSTSDMRWHPWVFRQLELKPGMKVLECGCGPAWLWRENVAAIPADCQIILTDLSEGMVGEAKATLADGEHDFKFETASIDELPFDENSFDVVVANHMLYHVPEREKALTTIRRVLKPNGRFLAATNGHEHMVEMRQLIAILTEGSSSPSPFVGERKSPFSLENGRQQLEPFFETVMLRSYPDSLAVTEVQPLIDYLLSSSQARAFATDERLAALQAFIGKQIETTGVFYITKVMGLFVAK